MTASRKKNTRRSSATRSTLFSGFRAQCARLLTPTLNLAVLLLLAVIVFAAFEALRSMPVERIVVTGKLENLRQAAIREALSNELGQGLVFLDLKQLQSRLEGLPWVYRAQLRRRFPETLEVAVIEQLPIARWGDDAFLNHEARVIDVADAQLWQELPQIRGPVGSESRLVNHYQRLLDRLGPLSLIPLALREDDFGQLTVTFESGMELHLGNRDFSERLQRFLRLWQRELAGSEDLIVRVDLRYPRAAAVSVAGTPQFAALSHESKTR